MKTLEFFLKVFFKPDGYSHAFFFVVIWTFIAEMAHTFLSPVGDGLFESILLDKLGFGVGLATLLVVLILIAMIGIVGTIGKRLFGKKK